MLVADASLTVELALDRLGERTSIFDGEQLVAPALLWSEVPSVLSEMAFRGEISDELARLALERLLDTRVVTLDMRLRRGADRLGLVVTPAELVSGKGVEGAR